MKIKLQSILFAAISIIFCILFGSVLLTYSRPMEDVSIDLSLIVTESHISQEVTDEKGWTVYTRHGDEIKELEPTGTGAYLGVELGETFYLSRVMSEKLDSPNIQIGTGEKMLAVWLGDKLLYTDQPELDNRIGYLTLPMNTTYRSEPVIITLPMDYEGKILTIAQSTPTYSETSTLRAYPSSVRLYCGYAYESAIVSESFSAAILMTSLFVTGVFLLIAFVRHRDASMLCIALSAFLWMCVMFENVSFFKEYFGVMNISIGRYARQAAAIALAIFLTLKASRPRKIMWFIIGVEAASTLFSLLSYSHFEKSLNSTVRFFTFYLMEWPALVSFIAILVLGTVFWRKEKTFFRIFSPASICAVVISWAVLLTRADVRTIIPIALASGQVTLLYKNTFIIISVTSLVCAIIEAIRQEIAHRTEKRLIEERRQITLESYKNIQRQHEEVMKIRHDMMGHFEAIKAISGDETQINAYLEELIGQNKKVRSVVQTGNSMLDIILNNKLSAAADMGIRVNTVKAEAPHKLPLSDADLCSLVMNIMDNALKASASSGADEPFISLDIHVRNDYFAFTCENSADLGKINAAEKTETVPRHGLGLKIIKDITDRYNGLIENEQCNGSYKLRIAIPLFSS